MGIDLQSELFFVWKILNSARNPRLTIAWLYNICFYFLYIFLRLQDRVCKALLQSYRRFFAQGAVKAIRVRRCRYRYDGDCRKACGCGRDYAMTDTSLKERGNLQFEASYWLGQVLRQPIRRKYPRYERTICTCRQ